MMTIYIKIFLTNAKPIFYLLHHSESRGTSLFTATSFLQIIFPRYGRNFVEMFLISSTNWICFLYKDVSSGWKHVCIFQIDLFVQEETTQINLELLVLILQNLCVWRRQLNAISYTKMENWLGIESRKIFT